VPRVSVPMIDLAGGPAGVAEEVRRACEDVGFLTVVGHGVDARLIEEVAARSRAFFDLPDAEKERFRAPAATPGLPVYRPLGAEKLGANADRKASLDWGPSLEGVGWPSPRLRDACERYYEEMLLVAGTLVRSFWLALALDEHGLDRFFDDRSSSLRVIGYPAGAGGARAGAHRDYGCLTIIHSDAGGLEVQTRSGEWLPVQAPVGGFVVNIGDLMQRWTGDRWVSTPPPRRRRRGRLAAAPVARLLPQPAQRRGDRDARRRHAPRPRHGGRVRARTSRRSRAVATPASRVAAQLEDSSPTPTAPRRPPDRTDLRTPNSGATMEPLKESSGRNRWQPMASSIAPKRAQSSRNYCRALRPVAERSAWISAHPGVRRPGSRRPRGTRGSARSCSRRAPGSGAPR
jgi:isopenicillin N synthase-like dioxygenase